MNAELFRSQILEPKFPGYLGECKRVGLPQLLRIFPTDAGNVASNHMSTSERKVYHSKPTSAIHRHM